VSKTRKSKPGRPATPLAERATPVNTTVSPAVLDYLTRSGGGSKSRGARLVLIRAAELAANGRNILAETA